MFPPGPYTGDWPGPGIPTEGGGATGGGPDEEPGGVLPGKVGPGEAPPEMLAEGPRWLAIASGPKWIRLSGETNTASLSRPGGAAWTCGSPDA
jgi:hypothetical protein